MRRWTILLTIALLTTCLVAIPVLAGKGGKGKPAPTPTDTWTVTVGQLPGDTAPLPSAWGTTKEFSPSELVTTYAAYETDCSEGCMGSKFQLRIFPGGDEGLQFDVGSVTAADLDLPDSEKGPCQFPTSAYGDTYPDCMGTFLNSGTFPHSDMGPAILSASFYNPNFNFLDMEVDETVSAGTSMSDGSLIEGRVSLYIHQGALDCTALWDGISSHPTNRVTSNEVRVTRTGDDTWRIDVQNLSLSIGEMGWDMVATEKTRGKDKGTFVEKCTFVSYPDFESEEDRASDPPGRWGFWTEPLNFSMTFTRVPATQ